MDVLMVGIGDLYDIRWGSVAVFVISVPSRHSYTRLIVTGVSAEDCPNAPHGSGKNGRRRHEKYGSSGTAGRSG
jgi:hypothetical protein